MPDRTILILNTSTGVCQPAALLDKLKHRLESRLGRNITTELTESHTQVTQATIESLRTPGPVTIIVAGGGGTLRAVVETVCRKRPAALKGNSVTLAQLHLGSGNALAKHLGIPQDPLKAIDVIADSILHNKTVLHPIIQAQSKRRTYYGATLCGLSQFGRIPADLTRWHARHPRLRRILSSIIGIEHLTLLEYPLALLRRCLGCAFSDTTADNVLLHTSAGRHRIPLLAGAIMTFPLNKLPFNPTASGKPPSVSAHLIPWRPSSALLLAIAPRFIAKRAIDTTLTTRDILIIEEKGIHEFFIDEDPETFNGWLAIGCAGSLPFITARQ